MSDYVAEDGRSYFDLLESCLEDWREHAPFNFPEDDLRSSHTSASFLEDAARRWLERLVVALEVNGCPQTASLLDRQFRELIEIAKRMDSYCKATPHARSATDPLSYDYATQAGGDSAGDVYDVLIASIRDTRSRLESGATTDDALVKLAIAQASTANQRMLEQLDDYPESCLWSQRTWGQKVGCTAANVAKTPAWQTILAMRAMYATDGVRPNDRRHNGKPSG